MKGLDKLHKNLWILGKMDCSQQAKRILTEAIKQCENAIQERDELEDYFKQRIKAMEAMDSE